MMGVNEPESDQEWIAGDWQSEALDNRLQSFLGDIDLETLSLLDPAMAWHEAIAFADKTGNTGPVRALLQTDITLNQASRSLLTKLFSLKRFGGENKGKLKIDGLGVSRTQDQQNYFEAMIEFYRLQNNGFDRKDALVQCVDKFPIAGNGQTDTFENYLNGGSVNPEVVKRDKALAKMLAWHQRR